MSRHKIAPAKRFDDPLGEPIFRQSILSIALTFHGHPEPEMAAIWREVEQWVLNEKIKKLQLLARRYDIDLTEGSGFARLAFRIAEECIEGFRVVDQRPRARKGRPAGSTKVGGLDLVKAIERLRGSEPKISVSSACKRLVRRPGRWKNESASSLETRYYEWFRQIKKMIAQGKQAQETDPLFVRLRQVVTGQSVR